jgi:predicted RecA/RadA family phage recombinase
MTFLFDCFLLCKSDCVAATSMAAQEATLEHNFGMFNIPRTSKEVMEAIQVPTLKN